MCVRGPVQMIPGADSHSEGDAVWHHPCPKMRASFTGNKLKRRMSQGTSNQSHFHRTEITNTPNSRVYGHFCAAEIFAQLHEVILCRTPTLPGGKRPDRKKEQGGERERGNRLRAGAELSEQSACLPSRKPWVWPSAQTLPVVVHCNQHLGGGGGRSVQSHP